MFLAFPFLKLFCLRLFWRSILFGIWLFRNEHLADIGEILVLFGEEINITVVAKESIDVADLCQNIAAPPVQHGDL